ncbi:MAG: hypothetical protein ACREP6_04145 [Candidatus Binataceae bacterium]
MRFAFSERRQLKDDAMVNPTRRGGSEQIAASIHNQAAAGLAPSAPPEKFHRVVSVH